MKFFLTTAIDYANGELHPGDPLSQVEQLFMSLSEKAQVLVNHIRI